MVCFIIELDILLYFSNPVVAAISAALHHKLVLTELAVKLHVWKTADASDVFAQKATTEIDVRSCPEAALIIQNPQTARRVCV